VATEKIDNELMVFTECPFCEEVYWIHEDAERRAIRLLLGEHIIESHAQHVALYAAKH